MILFSLFFGFDCSPVLRYVILLIIRKLLSLCVVCFLVNYILPQRGAFFVFCFSVFLHKFYTILLLQDILIIFLHISDREFPNFTPQYIQCKKEFPKDSFFPLCTTQTRQIESLKPLLKSFHDLLWLVGVVRTSGTKRTLGNSFYQNMKLCEIRELSSVDCHLIPLSSKIPANFLSLPVSFDVRTKAWNYSRYRYLLH